MNVKLLHDIADRRDIELVAIRQSLERARDRAISSIRPRRFGAEIDKLNSRPVRRGTRISQG